MEENVVSPKMDNKDIPNPGEVESEFPGRIASWVRFLNKNLDYPDRTVNAEITGEVRLEFVIGIDGTIAEADINRSLE